MGATGGTKHAVTGALAVTHLVICPSVAAEADSCPSYFYSHRNGGEKCAESKAKPFSEMHLPVVPKAELVASRSVDTSGTDPSGQSVLSAVFMHCSGLCMPVLCPSACELEVPTDLLGAPRRGH
jgi:hypothetical protein